MDVRLRDDLAKCCTLGFSMCGISLHTHLLIFFLSD
jgi:hypothetical protein